jgi:hypothetical protein
MAKLDKTYLLAWSYATFYFQASETLAIDAHPASNFNAVGRDRYVVFFVKKTRGIRGILFQGGRYSVFLSPVSYPERDIFRVNPDTNFVSRSPRRTDLAPRSGDQSVVSNLLCSAHFEQKSQ